MRGSVTVHMDAAAEKGTVYWTQCTVTACEPNRECAFAVTARPFGLPIAPRNNYAKSADVVVVRAQSR
jgi:hypothetical protein